MGEGSKDDMSTRVETLEVATLIGELDALRPLALGAGPGSGSDVLEHARTLLQRIRVLPGAPGTGGVDIEGNWCALRFRLDDGNVEVACLLAIPGSDTELRGRWVAGELTQLSLRVDTALWSEQATTLGPSRFSSDGRLRGEADAARFAELGEGMREELDEWRHAHPDLRWTCRCCEFQNAALHARCALCGATASGTPGVVLEAPAPAVANPTAATGAVELALPADFFDQEDGVGPTLLMPAIDRGGREPSGMP
jgi:hypothetical protein